jgi:acetylornithine deacetylase/succinyl-diaminopimelate desuccinylase-like protein
MAAFVVEQVRELGLEAIEQPVEDGRPNIVAVLSGRQHPVLLLEAHMDTVPVSGDAQARAVLRGGRIHGRGSCDTKGSLVAMLEALHVLRKEPAASRCTVMLAATIGEEAGAEGIKKFIADGPRPDMAVVGEPTGLAGAIAHKGIVRFRIHTYGSPAHSARPELGVNAVYAIAPVLEALQQAVIAALAQRDHPLVGRPTMAVTSISGGVAENVVPAECTIGLDRRLNPDEEVAAALEEVDVALSRVSIPGVRVVRDEPWFVLPPLNTPPTHPLARALTRAREKAMGAPPALIGMPYGSDGSWLSAAGIPTVLFGPGSIDNAHTDDEWVEVADVARAAEVLAELARILAAGEPTSS